ncbi:Protein of unknown function [Zobellia uliginosa]|uniref:DUF2931 family protein n=2 Tax=Zobellia uliginosa TaxID=143224 RepID=A0ABY1L0V3_9FLAO|nr:Protein of unknown function [Zobellia uliginosa]
MTKKNLIKKSALGFFILGCICLAACQSNLFMNKYEYTSGITAARYYPAYIIDGGFHYPGGGVYIPNDRVLSLGTWGMTSTTHVSGEDFKPVPDSFSISWLCLAERQSYSGTFDLPVKKLDSLFKTGFKDRLNRQKTYNKLIVGVAPGGVVVVWISGGDLELEIGRYQAEKIPPIDIKSYMPSSDYKDTDDFIDFQLSTLDETAKAALDVNNIPFGQWDKWRKRYTWHPSFKFKNNQKLRNLVFNFYNGEGFFIKKPNPILTEDRSWGVPKYIKPTWYAGDTLYGAIIELDETETFEAFQHIFEQENSAHPQFMVEVDKYNSEIKVYLKNEARTIELVKARKNIYLQR